MQLSETQMHLLQDLYQVIADVYGLHIGWSSPSACAIYGNEEFILYSENMEYGEPTYYLKHRDFFTWDEGALQRSVTIWERCKKAEEFWAKLMGGMADGTIYIPTTKTLDLNGRAVTLTQQPKGEWTVLVDGSGKEGEVDKAIFYVRAENLQPGGWDKSVLTQEEMVELVNRF